MSLNISHVETQCEVSSEGVCETATKFPWIHQSGHAAGYNQCPVEKPHTDQRELNCCVATPETKENTIHKIFVGVTNNSGEGII